MRLHRYPPSVRRQAILGCAFGLLALAGCDTHINADCPPGSRCVIICEPGGQDCRVEVNDGDSGTPDPAPSAQPEPTEEPEPRGDEPEPVEEPEPRGGEPEPAPAPEPDADAACRDLCEAFDKDSSACALTVLEAAHPDCERPPVCEDLLDAANCLACLRALGSDCGAIDSICVP